MNNNAERRSFVTVNVPVLQIYQTLCLTEQLTFKRFLLILYFTYIYINFTGNLHILYIKRSILRKYQ